ncbi:MAG: hypothetical protein ACKOKF_03840, partial [Bacteroidota bacterium]
FSGIFRKDVRLMAISMLVVFLYGSLAWGILPIDPRQSWETHLAGSIAGLFVAIYYKSEGPQRKLYQWEIDEQSEAEKLENQPPVTEIELESGTPAGSKQSVEIRYDYKPNYTKPPQAD